MQKKVVLEINEKARNFMRAEYENLSLVSIRNRQRMLRKFVKLFKDEDIIIKHEQSEHHLINNRIKIYNKISHESVPPIINKVCRQVATRYNMQIPFEEIVILANPPVSFSFIIPLMGISRLFTVVSDEMPGKKADELYFKHGCIIRHMSKFKNTSGNDKIIIRADKKEITEPFSIPVIDTTGTPINADNVIDIYRIWVTDERIKPIAEKWGGTSGLMLYNLFGLLPAESAEADINNRADKIFLLDTEKF